MTARYFVMETFVVLGSSFHEIGCVAESITTCRLFSKAIVKGSADIMP